MNRNPLLLILLMMIPFSVSPRNEGTRGEYMLIDDFNRDVSALGNPWEGFTDAVMGGKSEMTVSRVYGTTENYIRMTGNVSLKNRGGFIQIRQKLNTDRSSFDASSFNGLRLRVRGSGQGYYIFVRTKRMPFPWQFYKASFPVSNGWNDIEIPWSQFEKGDYGGTRKLNTSRLKSLAIVAYGRESLAMIDVSEIGFYE